MIHERLERDAAVFKDKAAPAITRGAYAAFCEEELDYCETQKAALETASSRLRAASAALR